LGCIRKIPKKQGCGTLIFIGKGVDTNSPKLKVGIQIDEHLLNTSEKR
jgi:hypothetical protein